jgi:hypothetical protein
MSDARTQPKNIVPDDYVPNLDERVISGDALPDAKSLSDPAALALADKLATIEQIKRERDKALAGGLLWQGKEWHLDDTFQQHLTGLIAAFATGVLPPTATVPIRTRANTIEQLTYDQLKALATAVLSRVQEIWAESWAKKDALG